MPKPYPMFLSGLLILVLSGGGSALAKPNTEGQPLSQPSTVVTQKPIAPPKPLLSLRVSSNPNLLLGNPSNATSNINNPDNYLMEKSQFVLSYNNSKHIPNWVSWQLNSSWLGNAERQNYFLPDDSLPKDWYHVKPNDYIGSGYDRGHMIPSADRTRNITDNSATFLMTDMIPQSPDNNQGPWADLENYSRELAKEGKELYIISGGLGSKGTIGKKAKITIPAKTWKVIVVLDKPGLGLKGITANTRTIAIEMPNDQGIRAKNWKSFRVSVKQVEKDTGLDFLSNVSPNIQNAIESKVDTN
jgi:endonuclease G, mitochondrial